MNNDPRNFLTMSQVSNSLQNALQILFKTRRPSYLWSHWTHRCSSRLIDGPHVTLTGSFCCKFLTMIAPELRPRRMYPPVVVTQDLAALSRNQRRVLERLRNEYFEFQSNGYQRPPRSTINITIDSGADWLTTMCHTELIPNSDQYFISEDGYDQYRIHIKGVTQAEVENVLFYLYYGALRIDNVTKEEIKKYITLAGDLRLYRLSSELTAVYNSIDRDDVAAESSTASTLIDELVDELDLAGFN